MPLLPEEVRLYGVEVYPSIQLEHPPQAGRAAKDDAFIGRETAKG